MPSEGGSGSSYYGGGGTNLKCLLPQSAEIKNDQFKFLILMMPTDTSVPFFIQELNKHDCKCVVRVCESKYSLEPFKQANIQVNIPPSFFKNFALPQYTIPKAATGHHLTRSIAFLCYIFY